MVINKIYPHVNVTTTALIRNPVELVDNGATTLFVPFLSKRGLSNKAQKIFNLNQFVAEYGEPDFSYQGRTILNAYNWLNAGGAVYALRLVGDDAEIAEGSDDEEIVTFTAKYPGSYYNGITVNLRNSIYTTSSVNYIDVTVFVGGVRVAQFFKRGSENFVNSLQASEFFSSVSFSADNGFSDLHAETVSAGAAGITVSLEGGEDSDVSLDRLVKHFFDLYSSQATSSAVNLNNAVSTVTLSVSDTSGLRNGEKVRASSGTSNYIQGTVSSLTGTSFVVTVEDKGGTGATVTSWDVLEVSTLSVLESGNTLGYETIGSKLEYPIDLILDAGHSETTKKAIANFTAQETGDRSDITVIFDSFHFASPDSDGSAAEVSTTNLNHAVYAQKLVVNDVIASKDIWVTPTYFLASLIPANDRIYGIQWPTAGLTRGVLTGVKSINENPTEVQKQQFYQERTNYIEKDSRGYKFMSQSTKESDETALRFLNNVRVTNRMVRDLEDLGREYLFEFNDSATLTNLRNALSRYVTEWIQNRTLSLGTVDVRKSEQSDERVDVTLNIRFTGTIEIISIDITIE
jgi:hypothetical protein